MILLRTTLPLFSFRIIEILCYHDAYIHTYIHAYIYIYIYIYIFFNSGYMAPEYAMEGLFSIKLDVYSFGILMMEIVSGKKNSGFNHLEHAHSLLSYVRLSSLYLELK